MRKRNRIFISYSHNDNEYLKRLLIHLAVYQREGLIDVWADTKIKPGNRWLSEIKSELSQAGVAILLISADFLASNFIMQEEIPPLLAGVQNEGVTIIPVILKPCAFEDVQELREFQAVNSPDEPLISLSDNDKEVLWLKVAQSVKGAVSYEHIPNTEGNFFVNNEPINFDEIFGSETSHIDYESGNLGGEIANPSSILNYFVYKYEHLDFLDFVLPPDRFLEDVSNKTEILEEVKELFSSAGWEGDGSIGLIWFPPFIDIGVEDTWGFCVWHVKQSNNGVSWLASPVELPFERLRFQNE